MKTKGVVNIASQKGAERYLVGRTITAVRTQSGTASGGEHVQSIDCIELDNGQKLVLIVAEEFNGGEHMIEGVMLAADVKLSKAQQRIFDEVTERGSVTYNGRVRKPIEALEKVGLVDVHWSMRACGIGMTHRYVDVITVRPKVKGKTDG